MAETATTDGLQSIPALLARNAAQWGGLTAYREKEFGIWQSWTWAATADEVRAIALGFLSIGMERGDHVAIIGRNRPALYWSMVAAQMCGAVPVPLYQDAVAEEMAYVLDHCGARFVVAGDQEQVDKVLEVQERLPGISHIAYLDRRGMRKYDHSRMNALADIAAEGRAGHHRFEASKIGEIVPGADFYDYADKYLSDNAKLIAPAELPDEVEERIRRIAVEAFAAIGGAGMARVDFLLDGERAYVNEINTIPGFTRISMYPRLWALSGVPLPELVKRLVDIALERHRERQGLDAGIKDFLAELHAGG